MLVLFAYSCILALCFPGDYAPRQRFIEPLNLSGMGAAAHVLNVSDFSAVLAGRGLDHAVNFF